MNVECRNIKKTYGSHVVLEIEHLHIQSGSFVGIIGANGCGKTTLLSIIASILEKDSGEILYDHEHMNEKIRKQITMVFQKPMLTKGDVACNIEYPLKIRGIEKKDRQILVENKLHQIGLFESQNRIANTLSGGEKQKVALARATVFSPSLLLLDEPTANIDPLSIQDMEKMMRNEHEKGTTIVMVTHNVVQAARLCSHIVFMQSGKVQEAGTVEEVIWNPQQECTKQFIKDVVL